MELSSLIIPTGLAYPGTTVAELFSECVKADVQGIPFRDANGNIVGKASIRHVLKENCIPDFMVQHAHLLGDKIQHLLIPDNYVCEVLSLPIDDFILSTMAVATSATPITKAIAIMENMDATYLFIIDDGVYKGIVSIMGIAQAMLQIQRQSDVD
ncbi:MAG: CBS domain-containing protein [Methylococcales bacterium]